MASWATTKRWLWRALLGLLLLLLLIGAGAWLYLSTDSGSQWLRAWVLENLKDSIAGKLEAQTLSLEGSRLTLQSAKLYTPEGELVAELAEAELDVSLTALLSRRFQVQSAQVRGLRLYLVNDERGLNLTRALAAKSGSQQSDDSPPQFYVEVKKLALTEGYLSWQGQHALEGISIDGDAVVQGSPLKLKGAAQAKAVLAGEKPLPVAIDLTAREQDVDGSVHLGDARLKGSFSVESNQLHVVDLFVPPDVAERFTGKETALKVPLKGKGTLSPRAVDVQLSAGGSRLSAQADLSQQQPSFELAAEGVDLAELLGEGQPAQLKVNAKGKLADRRLESLTGDIEVDASWAGVGQLRATASAKDGDFTVKRLAVEVRGATAQLSGRGNSKGVDLRGGVQADDLSQLARALEQATGSEQIPLAGSGSLNAALSGPLRRPRLSVDGELQSLELGDITMGQVRLNASLADVTRPLEAQLDAEAKRLTVSERDFSDVKARVETKGRELTLSVSARGLTDLALNAQGTLDRNAKGLALSALSLQYPGQEWRLESPTHLSFAAGLDLEPATLVAGTQRLFVRASLKKRRVDGLLQVSGLELSRLPAALLPAQLGLQGQVDGEAAIAGRGSAPELDLKAQWRQGRLRSVGDIELTFTARSARQRVVATASGSSSAGALRASCDIPWPGLRNGSDETLAAEIELRRVDLAALGPTLGAELPLRGTADVWVSAAGTAREPSLSARAEASDALWEFKQKERSRYLPFEQLKVEVQPLDGGKVRAQLKARALSAVAEAAFESRFPLSAIVSRFRSADPNFSPAREAWAQLKVEPMTFKGAVRHLQLAEVSGAHLLDEVLDGAVGLSIDARGSLQRPVGEATVTLENFDSKRVRPFDAQVKLRADEHRATVWATADRAQAQLLHLEMFAEAPLEPFGNVETLGALPLSGTGTLGPFALETLLDPAGGHQPRGTVKASVEVKGTAADPWLNLVGQLEQVAFGKVPLGKANFSYGYEKERSQVAVTLFTGSSGTLRAKGNVQLDLSQKAWTRPFNWAEAPFSLQVVSNGLDLSFLSGTFDAVPRIEGRLDATAHFTGSYRSPRLIGDVAFSQGKVGVQGYGEYRDVELVASGSDEVFTLEKLFAKSGAGYAELRGAARRERDGWHLRAQGECQNLPIVVEDQLKATATLEGLTATGRIDDVAIDLQRVVVARALVELPDVKGKELQDLERPDSIVLVRNGVPIHATERKRGELASAPDSGSRTKRPWRVFRAAFDARKNLRVKSSDVNVEVGLSDGFQVESGTGATALAGEVRVREGSFGVFGRQFALDSASTVRFAGPVATRTFVSITATHRNEREGVVVTATVVGQYPNVTPRFTSSPPLSESDIFALIATGRRTLKQGGSAAITNDQVVSVLGALGATLLKNTLGKKLPLDVLSIETGSEGLKGTRVEGGKYLTDDFYVGLEARYGADPSKGENEVAARVQWEFVPHWSVEAYGGTSAYGAELVWSREF